MVESSVCPHIFRNIHLLAYSGFYWLSTEILECGLDNSKTHSTLSTEIQTKILQEQQRSKMQW